MNNLRFSAAKVILFYDMCKKNRSDARYLEARDTRQITQVHPKNPRDFSGTPQRH